MTLYAAPAGSRAHGADFAAVAAAAGAVACLTDEAGAGRALAAGLPTYSSPAPRAVLGRLAAWVYGEPAQDLTLIGVTGTNGKTTTAYLLESGLRAAGRSTGLVGTIETRVGDEVLPSVRTTPEAPDLQALFAVMRERGVGAVAMEVSSHALAMGRVDGTTYDVAVFTNLSAGPPRLPRRPGGLLRGQGQPVHADVLAAGRGRRRRRARPAARRPRDGAGGHRLTGRGAGGLAGRRTARLGADGSRFVLAGPDGVRLPCATGLAGDFNLANAALAVVALVQAGVAPELAAAGVAACPGVPGRMERVDVRGRRPVGAGRLRPHAGRPRAAAGHGPRAGRRRWPAGRR